MTQEEINRILADNPPACTFAEAREYLDRVRDTWDIALEVVLTWTVGEAMSCEY